MKKYIKTILIMGFMFTSGMVLAFPNDAPIDNDPPAPIDNYILILIALGIGLVYWKSSKITEKI